MEHNDPSIRESTRSPMAGFFAAIEEDTRVKLVHIGLYAALMVYWQQHGRGRVIFPPPRRIMDMAKVSGRTTYQRYLRELHAYGYIRYVSSYYPRRRSAILLLILPSAGGNTALRLGQHETS